MFKKIFGQSKSNVSQTQRLFTDITIRANIVDSPSTTKHRSNLSLAKLVASFALAGLVLVFPFTALAEDQTPTTPPATDQTTAPSDTPTTPPATNQTPPPTTDPTPAPTNDTPSTPPTSPSPATPQPPAATGPQTPTGPQSPTGPDSKTYTFNKETGLWENAYYSWNPKTGQTAPKSDPHYYFDPTTKTWSTDKWTYSPESGKYIAVPTPVGPLLANQLASSLAGPGNNGTLDPLASILGTGPNSNNEITSNNQSTGFFDLFSKAAITNNLSSTATSGNASVSDNTLAGAALSGDASAMSNVINAVNSVLGLFTRPITTYLKNIYGTVTGDISLNPDVLATASQTTGSNTVGSTGPNSNNVINSNNGVDTTLNAVSNGSITNNVDLNATSGDATVTKNTQAGDATSGMATAVTNIMNLINTSISSGNSFLGMINIFGDYNGNVLFPPGFLDSVMAQVGSSNTTGTNSVDTTGPNSNNLINNSTNNTTNANNTSNNTVNNNVNLAAHTGQATVTDNTVAGSATSGNANSNLTLINMTGQNVVGKNAFLVVVNVLGHWVGMIMNAPAGATSAVLGDNSGSNSVENTGPNSNNQINTVDSSHTTIDATSNNTITNNVNATATSGNANVSGNTRAGNATTGDAKAAANIVNIANSNLSLSDWFGVLFINVFGNWVGNVGSGSSAATSQSTGSNPADSNNSNAPHVIVFVPKNATSHQTVGNSTGSSHNNIVAANSGSSSTGSGSLIANNGLGGTIAKTTASVKTSLTKNLGVTATLFGAALTLFALERILYLRKRRILSRAKIAL